MISQFPNVLVSKKCISDSQSLIPGFRWLLLSGAIALLCGGWMPSTNAAERSLSTVSLTAATAKVSSKQTASVLGEPVVTNYVAFRDYCKNPINTTELKTLCLSMIGGGPLDAGLEPEDEPLTSMASNEAEETLLPQPDFSSAIALYQYNPILYQYDKVTLYPLR